MSKHFAVPLGLIIPPGATEKSTSGNYYDLESRYRRDTLETIVAALNEEFSDILKPCGMRVGVETITAGHRPMEHQT